MVAMAHILLYEEYGDYDLTVGVRSSRVLAGFISGSSVVPVPDRAIARLHGGAADLEQYPEIKTLWEIPVDNWSYHFCCNRQGDLNEINGEQTANFSSGHSDRVWTPGAVLAHMKDCLAL